MAKKIKKGEKELYDALLVALVPLALVIISSMAKHGQPPRQRRGEYIPFEEVKKK